MPTTKAYIESFKCSDCGAPLINTDGGRYSACPEGCGRLHPKLSPAVARINAAKVCAGATAAVLQVNGNYEIMGRDGSYKRDGRAISRCLSGHVAVSDERCVGIDDGKIYWFKRIDG